MKAAKHMSRDYSWVKYVDDDDMVTVREIVIKDIFKCYTQAEALAMIARLRKTGDGVGQ